MGGLRSFACLGAALLAGLMPVRALGNPHAEQELSSLALEDLMEIEVTSVSKRAVKLSRAPAAATVLTAEEIRRSGVTTIPEALRMVPGLHVAQINASNWAISSRGFTQQFANKLLVMIDGRSVYSPLFSGVFWNLQDVMLEDIDRIEVVRGPGGTIWGANAVNGVINIITKSAEETQGLLATSATGSYERAAAAGRYGGSLGDSAFYRGYVKYFDREGFEDRDGVDAHDDWNAIRGGFRFDWTAGGADSVTFQGDYHDGESDFTTVALTEDVLDYSGGNILARWTHAFSEDSNVQIQSYFDRTELSSDLFREDRNTFDVEFQHRFLAFARNDVVWGGGYRLTSDDIRGSSGIQFAPDDRTDHLASLFVQDEITLLPDLLEATLGSKFEFNDYTGFEIQPSARVLVTPHVRHSFWAAVSRAVRTPSRSEHDVRFLQQVAPGVFNQTLGDSDFDSEQLLAYEVGFRSRPFDSLSLDVAAYYNVYDDLRTGDPGATLPVGPPDFPPGSFLTTTTLGNKMDGEAYGVEVAASWQAASFWTLSGHYTLMKLQLDPDPGSTDPQTESDEDDIPTNQFHVRSRLDLPWDLELDTAFYYVGNLASQGVGAYTRFDTRLAWQPFDGLELSVVGQNLFEPDHAEFGNSETHAATEVPRSVFGMVRFSH